MDIINDVSFADITPVTLNVMVPAENGYASAILADNPVGYWPLDEATGATTAYDYWGGHNGTYDVAAVPGVPGPQFGGFEADNLAVQVTGAAGSRVALPALNLYTNAVTITGWINPTGDQGNWRGIVFCRAGNTVAGVHFGSNNELRYTWNNAGATYNWPSGLVVPTNQWSFFALVITPTNGTLYLGAGGILQSAVNNVTHDLEEFNGTTYIGQDTAGDTRIVNGIIDDVAIYNQSLGLGAIGNLYLTGTGQPFEVSLAPATGPVVLDSKPLGLPHDGINAGAGWLDSQTDGFSTTRSGIMQFVASEGDQIKLPANSDFDSQQGTIAFWMLTAGNDTSSGNEGAILFDRRTSDGDVIVLKDDGTLFVQNNRGGNSFSTVNTVNDDRWHHIAYVYDGSATGSISIYIDGVLDKSQNNANAWVWPVKQSIEIGRSHDAYWRKYNGSLDDFRIYNRMLDVSELTAIVSGDDAAVVAPDAMTVRFNFNVPPQGSSMSLSWPYGILEEAEDIVGPWFAVSRREFAVVGAGGSARAVLPRDRSVKQLLLDKRPTQDDRASPGHPFVLPPRSCPVDRLSSAHFRPKMPEQTHVCCYSIGCFGRSSRSLFRGGAVVLPVGKMLEFFQCPGKKRHAGRIEHPVRDHRRPDGLVHDHDDAQPESQHGRQAHRQGPLHEAGRGQK